MVLAYLGFMVLQPPFLSNYLAPYLTLRPINMEPDVQDSVPLEGKRRSPKRPMGGRHFLRRDLSQAQEDAEKISLSIVRASWEIAGTGLVAKGCQKGRPWRTPGPKNAKTQPGHVVPRSWPRSEINPTKKRPTPYDTIKTRGWMKFSKGQS